MLTDINFIERGNVFPPQSETQRTIKYSQNENLFLGKHSIVFHRWARTSGFDGLNVIANWPKRLSLLWADMLFGQEPEIQSDKPDNVQSFLQRNDFFNRAYEASLDVSRYGVGILKVRNDGKNSIVETVSPHIWYPVFNPMNSKEYVAHVLAWTYKGTGDDGEEVTYLNVEMHEKGQITYRTYKMQDKTTVHGLVSEDVELTGYDGFLVFPVHNITTSDNPFGIDDYDDIAPLLEEIEMRLTQIGRILNKHADPSMYGDESALEYNENTGEYVIRGGGSFFPVSEGGTAPNYLTWDGKLEDNFKAVDQLMEQFYAITNTSPASFGQLKSGLAESGSALKRLLMATIMKANRLKVRWSRVLIDVVEAAMVLQDVQIDNTRVEWMDSLPEDETENTNNEVQKYVQGLTSLEASVGRLTGLSGDQLAQEVQKIQSEQQDTE